MEGKRELLGPRQFQNPAGQTSLGFKAWKQSSVVLGSTLKTYRIRFAQVLSHSGTNQAQSLLNFQDQMRSGTRVEVNDQDAAESTQHCAI